MPRDLTSAEHHALKAAHEEGQLFSDRVMASDPRTAPAGADVAPDAEQALQASDEKGQHLALRVLMAALLLGSICGPILFIAVRELFGLLAAVLVAVSVSWIALSAFVCGGWKLFLPESFPRKRLNAVFVGIVLPPIAIAALYGIWRLMEFFAA